MNIDILIFLLIGFLDFPSTVCHSLLCEGMKCVFADIPPSAHLNAVVTHTNSEQILNGDAGWFSLNIVL
jgi:hypothetical protein